MFTKKNEESLIRIQELEEIKRVFDKYGVKFYIVYGALLGYYRDGKFLPDDDDIDIAVIDPIDYKTRKDIGWDLFYLGFEPQPTGFNVFGRMEAEMGYNGTKESGIIVCERKTKFTIFFFKEVSCETHGQEYVCIPKYKAYTLISIPTKFFKKSDTIKIGRNKYLTPSPIKDYLAYSYEDWKDKKKRDHSPLYVISHPEYNEWVKKELESFRNE